VSLSKDKGSSLVKSYRVAMVKSTKGPAKAIVIFMVTATTKAGKANVEIIIPGKSSDRIQEMHMKIIHTVIECVERQLFPENY
jgi:phosphoheptose isomerase